MQGYKLITCYIYLTPVWSYSFPAAIHALDGAHTGAPTQVLTNLVPFDTMLLNVGVFIDRLFT